MVWLGQGIVNLVRINEAVVSAPTPPDSAISSDLISCRAAHRLTSPDLSPSQSFSFQPLLLALNLLYATHIFVGAALLHTCIVRSASDEGSCTPYCDREGVLVPPSLHMRQTLTRLQWIRLSNVAVIWWVVSLICSPDYAIRYTHSQRWELSPLISSQWTLGNIVDLYLPAVALPKSM